MYYKLLREENLRKLIVISFISMIVLNLEIATAQSPSNEMYKSEIALGSNVTQVTLEYFEKVLKESGNTVSYKIKKGNEIILLAKKFDDKIHKSSNVNFHFIFVKSESEGILFLNKCQSGKEKISVNDLYFTVFDPLNNRINEELKQRAAIKTQKKLKEIQGIYKGHYIDEEDELSTKIDIELTLITDNDQNQSGKLKYDGKYFELDWSYINGEVLVNYKDSERHTANIYEFTGTLQNNIYSGKVYIMRTINEPRFWDRKIINGAFELKKIPNTGD